jgi:ADP-ribosylglycohydrolase
MIYCIILLSLLISSFCNQTQTKSPEFQAETCGLLKDRIAGAFLGAAIGDALGRFTEFIPSIDEIKRKFGQEGITKFEEFITVYSPATASNVIPYTDDTVMALVLAKTILEGRQSELSVNAIMDRLARSYVQLLGRNRYIIDPLFTIRAHGIQNLKACQILQQYIDCGVPANTPLWWYRNSDTYEKRYFAYIAQEGGCGSVMRAWPIGIIFADNIPLIKELADKQSCITHRHPMARAASVALAVGVSQSLLQKSPEEVAQAMIYAAREFEDRELLYKKNARRLHCEEVVEASMIANDTLLTSDMLRYALQMAKEGKEPAEVLGIFNDKQANFRSSKGYLLGWSADEAVAAALYIFMRHSDDLQAALIEGANTPGDSDSIASLAGALVGARTGIELLNYCEFDYSSLENLAYIKSLATSIHDTLAVNLVKKGICV